MSLFFPFLPSIRSTVPKSEPPVCYRFKVCKALGSFFAGRTHKNGLTRVPRARSASRLPLAPKASSHPTVSIQVPQLPESSSGVERAVPPHCLPLYWQLCCGTWVEGGMARPFTQMWGKPCELRCVGCWNHWLGDGSPSLHGDLLGALSWAAYLPVPM